MMAKGELQDAPSDVTDLVSLTYSAFNIRLSHTLSYIYCNLAITTSVFSSSSYPLPDLVAG
jgi:subtilase family serine protease